jgi:hypothetical protein
MGHGGEAQSDRSGYYAAMKATFRLLPLALSLLALPALAQQWEELRRNDQVRLSIDAKSIRAKGDEVSFRYLVDFKDTQGDVKTSVYRSLATQAAVRCKARTIAARGTEGYGGNEAKGPMVGILQPTKADMGFKKIEEGTSDEDLWKRVCEKKPAPKK